MKATKILTTAILIISFCCLNLRSQQNQHPLDPLTWQEHWTLLEVLNSEGKLDGDTRFSMVTLQEPDKQLVWDWSEGEPVPRAAYALVRQKEKSYKAIVDLVSRSISSWNELKDVQPNWMGQEFGAVIAEVKKHPDFIAAMKKRGIEDLTFIDCMCIPPGYYGTEEVVGKRVGHVHCNDVRGVRNNWTRGIEGLTAVVDLHENKVIRIVDEGIVDVPEVSADYDQATLGAPREVPGPIYQTQPAGAGFKREGHIIEWQNWRFHVRPDHRVGLVISAVTYQDGEDIRPVLYQGHLSEIFVPYMDPAFSWYHRNFLDAGEFTAGGLTKPLMAGLDCPENTLYLDGLIAGDNGRPRSVPRMVGIFERETGDMAWRHHTSGNEGIPESRIKRDLVVRAAAVLGNYDYIFDWIFQQDGSIRVAIGATGIAEAKAVNQDNALASASPGRAAPDLPADAYGRFVDKNVVAVNHDHYFSYRLDLDVDGSDNNLQLDRLVSTTLPDDHPRRSVWVKQSKIPNKESEAKLNINFDRPTLWRVTSTSRQNHVGYPTSYQLMAGMNGNTLLSEDDYPRMRAGFINHHLWTTPFDSEERYAAGEYPTLSTPGQGLPAWTAKNRSIENTDIVLWYTIGMHHMVRAEDWPVMPVLWHTFELRPFDFFDRNPSMDLPKK
jgi:primary-amine oxidase